MRIQYKGGVWKNSEDEILKAAVMKYGKNQWARIASLLVRKSAKQCKARWFEWLDPSIKKTPWTREEEEKLLHLAKIMPTAWRTIAPMIGRTATQCLERYELLIDQAQQGTDGAQGGDGAGPSSAGGTVGAAARTRPGEADPAPESKPARPDPVDMDEDELEMLSEARARLANTKGKKAKRKAREKQLEAAKRLAQLQKRRELKAAGVDLKPKKNNPKVTDYATEIPFERTPAPGFYDTTKEDNEIAANSFDKKKQLGKLLQKYKGKTAEEKEEEARKRDNERRKKLEKVNMPAALGYTQSRATPSSPPLKRRRFALPAPHVSDMELEKIAKAGLTPRNGPAEGDQVCTDDDFSSSSRNQQHGAANGLRSSNEPWAAVRQRHLDTILNLQTTETPLRGGVNTPLVGLGLESGATPFRSDLSTPNPLVTASPAAQASARPTTAAQAARDAKRNRDILSEQVRRGLQALPEPENEYEIEIDESALPQVIDSASDAENEKREEDAEDEQIRNKVRYADAIRAEQERLLSFAAQQKLPIPAMSRHEGQGSDPVAVLVTKDIETHSILRKLSKSEQTVATTLEKLRSLQQPNGKELARHLGTARQLIENQLSAQKEGGALLETLILEQLKAQR